MSAFICQREFQRGTSLVANAGTTSTPGYSRRNTCELSRAQPTSSHFRRYEMTSSTYTTGSNDSQLYFGLASRLTGCKTHPSNSDIGHRRLIHDQAYLASGEGCNSR